MKTYIITIILLCLGFLCLSQSKSVLATTSFNGFHCDGKQGICDIDNNNRAAANTTLVLQPNNTLTFTMERQKLSLATQEKIMGVNPQNLKNSKIYFFEVSNAYILPQTIQNLLSENGSYLTVAKGTYPILITENTLTITFNLE